MVRTLLSRLFLPNYGKAFVLLLAALAIGMADVFTPAPPPVPADCVAPNAPATQPSMQWIEDYYGQIPQQPQGNVSIGPNGIDGIWWPPGQQMQYIGRQLYFDGSEVNAGSGFEIIVPDGELWRVNWLAVDWVTNTGSGTRFFLLQVLDFLNTGFGYDVIGKATPTDNDGGSVTWVPGVQSVSPVTQQIMEPLPRPLLLYSQWRLEVQLNNGGADFLNSLRADIERWAIAPLPSGGGGSGSGGGSGGTSGSGSGSGGPIFQGPF